MDEDARTKSTNVRISGAAPLLATGLWATLVAALAWSGALERLGGDVAVLAAFACLVAALTYTVDGEVRAWAAAIPAATLAAVGAGLAASCALGPAAWLAAAPALVGCGAALVPRALALRFSSTAAASPGARRGGP